MSEAGVWDRLAGRYDSFVRLFDATFFGIMLSCLTGHLGS